MRIRAAATYETRTIVCSALNNPEDQVIRAQSGCFEARVDRNYSVHPIGHGEFESAGMKCSTARFAQAVRGP